MESLAGCSAAWHEKINGDATHHVGARHSKLQTIGADCFVGLGRCLISNIHKYDAQRLPATKTLHTRRALCQCIMFDSPVPYSDSNEVYSEKRDVITYTALALIQR
jgi:hypothetical protein